MAIYSDYQNMMFQNLPKDVNIIDCRCKYFFYSVSYFDGHSVCYILVFFYPFYLPLFSLFQVPDHYLPVVEITLREFFNALRAGRDAEPSWKKQIYKIIARYDEPIPDYFKTQEFLQQLEQMYTVNFLGFFLNTAATQNDDFFSLLFIVTTLKKHISQFSKKNSEWAKM